MQPEDNFHGGRSSRLFVLRTAGAAIFGAGKMLAERSEGAGPCPYSQTHRSHVQSPPGVDDGTLRPPLDWSWRAIPAAASAATAKTVAVLGACGELLICRALLSIASWIFKQALEGCAAYATAMYGIPADEIRDPRDSPDRLQTEHEHAARLVSQTSTEMSTNAKANVIWLAESAPAAPEAEFIAPPLAPHMGSPGWIASINSMAARIRSRIRGLFDRRVATAQLQSSDDRSLRDVGIYRCDIEYLMRHGDRRE
jgi:uncharacterized protein YjiS (DUF1127 family)